MAEESRQKALNELHRILARYREAGLMIGETGSGEWHVDALVHNGAEKVKLVVWFNAKGMLTIKVQGKATPFAESVRMLTVGSEPLTSSFFNDSVESWIGVDESGKGDYFGPLVTAAVLLTPDTRLQLKSVLLRDSKLMQPAAIATAAKDVRRICAGAFDIVVTMPERYNELLVAESFRGNSQNLLAWQHARAIENLLARFPEVTHAVVDQFSAKESVRKNLFTRGKNINVIERTKAEQDPAVAAAAILARDVFVHRMKQLKELAGIALPFGSSNEAAIEKAARHIVQIQGRSALGRFAKLHFKTTKKLGL